MRVLRFCYKIFIHFIMFGMQYIKKVENFANNKHKKEKNLLERDLYAQCQALSVKIAILNIFSHHFLVLRVLWYQKSCACYRKSGLKMFLNGHCKLIKIGHLFVLLSNWKTQKISELRLNRANKCQEFQSNKKSILYQFLVIHISGSEIILLQ